MRRSFLALLGLLPLAAKGQNISTCSASDPRVCEEIAKREQELSKYFGGPVSSSALGGAMGRPKPKNGECPVCGTMAPPYKRKTEREFYGTDVCLTRGEGNTTFAVCDPPSKDKLVGLMERTTRCAHCNAAFFQDAEK